MAEVERRLAELGFPVGPPPRSLGHYVRTVRAGSLVFTAGHGPLDGEGRPALHGQVGSSVTPDDARHAAALCVAACLGSIRAELGDLDRVTRVVKMLAFVNCAPGFNRTSAVVDGASELLLSAFGERGVHARSAIGTSVLPLDMPVEVELVVEVG